MAKTKLFEAWSFRLQQPVPFDDPKYAGSKSMGFSQYNTSSTAQKDPILKHERMCESSVPDWFYHSIADYTDADTDRDHDIKWFLDAVARVVDVAEDGKSFTFKPKAKQKYFERQYHAFLDKARELTGISLDAFVGEAKYDIGMAMYKLNEHYQDKFSLYVYFNDELKSLDEWIRETDLSGSFYFGGTLDYHY